MIDTKMRKTLACGEEHNTTTRFDEECLVRTPPIPVDNPFGGF